MPLSQLSRTKLAHGLNSEAAANEIARLLEWPNVAGNTYYVGSVAGNTWVAGSDTSNGLTPGRPLATIAAAMALCTAGSGDRIVLLPGHAETYSSTGSKLTVKAGVVIVGLGMGAYRPTFTFGHTGATWTLSGAGAILCNLLFVTSVDSVVTYGTISAADVTLVDIEGRDTTDVEVITDWTVTANAERLTVRRYVKNGYTGGNANVRVFSLAGVDVALFEHCRFITKVTTAVIGFVTTACTGIVVRGCEFLVASTTDFSKDIVDTVTGSVWGVSGDSFDIGAGQYFGGGSGSALAGVSLSSITDRLDGATGVATFPAAAAPANNVSLAEVERAIYNAVSYDSSASVVTTNPHLGKMVSKTENVNTATGVDLFTVTGKVLITALFGEVTNAIDAAVSDYKLRIKTDNVDLCAQADIGSAAVGTLYSLTGQSTDTLETNAEGVKTVDVGGKGLANRLVGLAGGSCTIQSLRTAGASGDEIVWTLWYIPLEASAAVAAA